MRIRFTNWMHAGWLAALLLSLMTAGTTHAQKTLEWKTYRYAADGFSAAFPSGPQESRNNVDTAAGAFELRSYLVQMDDAALFVGVCDYGAKAQGHDPDEMLQSAKGGSLENSNSHLMRENKISMGIYHGLEFESESELAHFRERIYMVGTTLYQTLVVSPRNSPYADTTRFLDSFQLIGRQKSE